ncbi:hypothetical protein RC1_0513 [Rhodospirillum centenum SW]|uniref:Uncharacterized protein n=1 Tax=Rhodospirillum centenum (strain ATCC 51521 / SW) TaxID=414684 RepID=B6IR64_RHOCS|nr:hypothetical protein RC1_0513 [Rhodospirillum centenum SW]
MKSTRPRRPYRRGLFFCPSFPGAGPDEVPASLFPRGREDAMRSHGTINEDRRGLAAVLGLLVGIIAGVALFA